MEPRSREPLLCLRSLHRQLLNIIGYFAYSVYTCVLKFAPRVTREYLALNGPPVPVDLSDVVFALWGLAITTFTIAQCFYYPSGDQLPAKWAVAVATALVLLADFAFVLCGCDLVLPLLLSTIHTRSLTLFFTFFFYATTNTTDFASTTGLGSTQSTCSATSS